MWNLQALSHFLRLIKNFLSPTGTDVGKFFGKYFQVRLMVTIQQQWRHLTHDYGLRKFQMSLMRDGENIDLYANEVQR